MFKALYDTEYKKSAGNQPSVFVLMTLTGTNQRHQPTPMFSIQTLLTSRDQNVEAYNTCHTCGA